MLESQKKKDNKRTHSKYNYAFRSQNANHPLTFKSITKLQKHFQGNVKNYIFYIKKKRR